MLALAQNVRDYLPRGNTLSDDVFATRHRGLCWLLAAHIPALVGFGVWRGFGISHSLLEMVVPLACLVFARIAKVRRLAAFFTTAGLVFCSAVLVHLSGGMIEAHFHFFILIGLIALYQDWIPFLWNIVFTVLSHGLGSALGAALMFNHQSGQGQPWTWSLIHGVAVLCACAGQIVFWRATENEQQRNAGLAADLVAARLSAEQRASVSELFVNLARRNQSLLDRQLSLIVDLESRERDADALAELFQLDHLATRIRRNAESLLVLSGDDSPRRWGRPVPLQDVVRAGVAEVEDYRRAEVLVDDSITVAGHAVSDVAHLLAELIENATLFSPPGASVLVRSHRAVRGDGDCLVIVEDRGIGMSDEDLRAANEVLAAPPDVDLRRSSMLGFHVVGRLAQRHGLTVRLSPTAGGGTSALVSLPQELLARTEELALEPELAGSLSTAAPPVPHLDGLPSRVAATSHEPLMPRRPLPSREPVREDAPAPEAVPAWRALFDPDDLPVARRTAVVMSDVSSPTTEGEGGVPRRVPGAGLAPGLRLPERGTTPPPAPVRTTAEARSMLSRFQASQRAGRALAGERRDEREEGR